MPVRLLLPILTTLCLVALGCAQSPPEVVEVPVTVEVLREVPVTVEVEREVTQAPIRVEKIVTVEVEKEVEVPVEVEVTREVTVEVIQEVTREVTVEVTREVTVVKNNPTPTAQLVPPTFTPTPTDSQECEKYLADIQQYVDFVENRYDAVGEILDKLAKGEISDNAAEIRNRSLYTEIRNESAERNLNFNRNRPPEILKPFFFLASSFSYANVRLMNAVFDPAASERGNPRKSAGDDGAAPRD